MIVLGMIGRLDDGSTVTDRRISNAQRKAGRLWPGPVGKVVASHLASMEDLRAIFGPSSLSLQLLLAVEALPEPATPVDTRWIPDRHG